MVDGIETLNNFHALIKHLQGQHDQQSHGRRGGSFNPHTASRTELEAKGYIPVFRGTGPKGMANIRPSEAGVLGPGVYFYDDAMQARTYAERGGGIITGFVHQDDVKIAEVPATKFSNTHNVIVLPDASKFIRRDDIPEATTRGDFWRRGEAERFEHAVNEALG